MNNSIKLGRLAGVAVELNWTVLAIAALVTFSVAGGILPAAAPGYETTTYVLGGVIAAAGLLASILAHELGHALVARRNGVAVKRISLWAFGGVAQLDGEAATPRAEFKIAGVGPAISLLLGFALFLPAAALSGIAGAVLGWLASINVILAVFNLIPGAPLDGGRLLHAWLWNRHGDKARATASATKAGRIVGSGLIGLGAVQFLLGGAGGLWTAFIGWFLRNAATAEGRYGALQRDLVDVRIGDIMTPSGPLIGDWMSVGAFIDRYAVEGDRSTYLLAGTDDRAAGLVTLRDLAETPVSERYTTSVRTVARSLEELPAVAVHEPAAELLGRIGSAPLAVVWDGILPVGTVTVSQFGAAVESARLLARLRGEQQPAA